MKEIILKPELTQNNGNKYYQYRVIKSNTDLYQTNSLVPNYNTLIRLSIQGITITILPI